MSSDCRVTACLLAPEAPSILASVSMETSDHTTDELDAVVTALLVATQQRAEAFATPPVLACMVDAREGSVLTELSAAVLAQVASRGSALVFDEREHDARSVEAWAADLVRAASCDTCTNTVRIELWIGGEDLAVETMGCEIGLAEAACGEVDRPCWERDVASGAFMRSRLRQRWWSVERTADDVLRIEPVVRELLDRIADRGEVLASWVARAELAVLSCDIDADGPPPSTALPADVLQAIAALGVSLGWTLR